VSFDLQGHRGAAGLAPENSLTAFGVALEVGVTTLELDVGVTADGAVVVAHDRRAPDGRPWHELTSAGVDVPTLDDVLVLAHDRGAHGVRFAVEAKLDREAPDETLPPEPFAARVLACIERHGVARRVLLMSFDSRVLVAARNLHPGLELALLSERDALGDVEQASAIGARVLGVRHELATPELVAAAHARGLRLNAWTVNDAARMAELLDLGVDGLATDFPDVARGVLAARGLPLPRRYPATAG
jgi:glycerophosphoryl diester phosphodiesterase